MERTKTNGRRIFPGISRRAGLDIAWAVAGAAVIVVAWYLNSQPDWTLRPDIQTLNRGVVAFHAPPGVMLAADGRPAEYPIERAAAFWEQAAVLTADPAIKSLANYDLGTLVGREAYAMSLAGTGEPRTDMAEGIRRLGQALRANPDNADAKFNLELMERKSQTQTEKKGGPGQGYGRGVEEKGY